MTRALALTLLVGGCTCRTPAVPDAGTPAVRVHRSIDLKTAVFTAYPEFRGARVMDGEAALVRTMDRPVSLSPEVLDVIAKNGFFAMVDAGTLVATRPPYTLTIDGPTLTVALPVTEGDIGKLLNAPLTMTSEQIALWYPKPLPGAVAAEEFRLRLVYDSIAWRAGYLAWQMVHLNTAGTWKVERYPDGYELQRRPDGGGGGTPEAYHLALVDSNTSARIEVHRDGGYVRLDYVLKTEEPVRNP